MTLLSLPFLIGFRFGCSRHRRSNTVSFVFIISVIGIAIGVAVLIIGLSAMNGFERELNNRVLAIVPHGEIKLINQPWKNCSVVLKKIEKEPGIISVAPLINFSGIIENKENFVFVQIKGINPKKEEYLSILSKFAKNNAWIKFKERKKQIIIGKGVADILKVKQNDLVSLTFFSPYKKGNNFKKTSRMRLCILDILDLNGQLSQNLAFIPIKDAGKYLGIGDGITGITVKVNNPFDAKRLTYNAAEKFADNYVYIESWTDTYGYIYHDIQTIRFIMYLTMILIIGIACFNIITMLLMAIKERKSDVAILRTLGMNNNFVYVIFMMYGFLSGLIGSLFGVIAGVFISFKLTFLFNKIENLIGNQFLSDKIYFINFFPSELNLFDIVCVFLIAIILSLIASWYPSYHACRIDPAIALKN